MSMNPTPDEVIDYLKAGKAIRFDPATDEASETDQDKAARTIQASWIQELSAEPRRSIEVPIEIDNAIIEGKFHLPYASFHYEVSITNSVFKDDVDLSFSTFDRSITFSGSTFQRPAIFRSIHTKFNFTIDQAIFPDGTEFSDIKIEEILSAAGARFGRVRFDRAVVKKNAVFRPIHLGNKVIPVSFAGEVRFVDASINGIAVFVGAQFEAAANFERIHIGSSAFFRSETFGNEFIFTRFKGKVSFLEARIEGTAGFDGVQFENDTSLERIKIGGSAFFRAAQFGEMPQPARFSGPATFRGASVQGNVDFNGAQFDDAVNFESIQVQGVGFFNSVLSPKEIIPTQFDGEANFILAQIEGGVHFNGAQFKDKVNFNLIKIGSNATFAAGANKGQITSATFYNTVEFTNASIQGFADFGGAQFKGKSIFEGLWVGGHALFRTVRVGTHCVPVRFESDVVFTRVIIQGTGEFMGAQFEKRAYFNLLNIEGSVTFRPAHFGDDVIHTTFKGDVQFTGSKIQGSISFDCSQFEQRATFDHIRIDGDASFRSDNFKGRTIKTTFFKECSFINADIRGSLDFRGVLVKGVANFTLVRIGGNAHFIPWFLLNDVIPTHFLDRTLFVAARIAGSAEFSGAQFEKEAIFHRIKISDSASFNSITYGDQIIQSQFKNTIDFSDAAVGARVNFNRCLFDGPANFNRTVIGANAIFTAQFRETASFVDASIQGNAIFDGTKFSGFANFDFIRIGRNALFRSNDDEIMPVSFEDDASFFGAQIQGMAEFQGSQFEGVAVFTNIQIAGNALFCDDEIKDVCCIPVRFQNDVVFSGAQFNSNVDFGHAHFAGQTLFERTRIDGAAKFDEAKFSAFLNLRDARFHTVYLSKGLSQSGSQLFSKDLEVDLLGFSYERITDWHALFKRMVVYDRQPYAHLERVIRATGDDRQADNIYLERRRLEMQKMRRGILHDRDVREIPRFLFDAVQKFLFNYGVRPYRLLVISTVILIIGVYMFTQPGAVRPKENTKSETPLSQPVRSTPEPITLNWSQSLGLSLRLFIPVVEIFSGSQWVPTENPAPFLQNFRMSFAAYASLHRLAGVVLVPLGIAILGGLIRRQAKP